MEKVILCSYPRSGNTLIRGYLERCTGIITGSDCDPSRKLNLDLIEMGMRGEGRVDDHVWIVKTHYPERYGFTRFHADKCILIVRNPLDCIASLYNMVATGTHNSSMLEDDFLKYPDVWDSYIKQEIGVWRDFHRYWLKYPIPTHIVRFEDLIMKPKDTLMDVFSFLLDNDRLEGTLIEALVQRATD